MDKQGRLITFQPNQLQLRHLKERKSHRYNYILKYRQGGITTLYSIDELDEALWVSGTRCAIIAHKEKKLAEYFNIVKLAYENLPELIKPKTKTDTKHMYEFTYRYDGAPLNSSIYVSLDVRGGTVHRMHITESSHIEDRQRLKTASKQAVPLTGFISEETTANGFEGFSDDYLEAYANPNPGEFEYKTYFYPWVQEAEYTIPGTIGEYTEKELEIKKIAKELYNINVTDGQLLWRRWKKNELRSKQEGAGLNGDQLMMQEYPLTVNEAFQSGAGNVFDLERVDKITPPLPLTRIQTHETTRLQYENQPEILNSKLSQADHLYTIGVKFWHLPQESKSYVIGCDPSDGTPGGDNAGVSVRCRETKEQVASYNGKARPDELARILADLGNFYNTAFVGVENNMLSTILFLKDMYGNYYTYVRIDKVNKERTRMLGWSTNASTRDPMIDDYIKYFDEGIIDIKDRIILQQMKTFIKKENGKREHAVGKHDDALFADFICIQMLKYEQPKARGFAEKADGF